MHPKKILWLCGIAGVAGSFCGTISPVVAGPVGAAGDGQEVDIRRIEKTMVDLQKVLAEQSKKLAAQEQALAQQAKIIASQTRELASLRDKVISAPELLRARAAGEPGAATGAAGQNQRPSADMQRGPGQSPASAAPGAPKQLPKVAAIPELGGVLTRAGRLMIEPTIQYSSSTVNQFSFLGVEVVPSFFIGLTQAQSIDRDIISPSVTARYGITSRLEGEVKVPYVHREDRVDTNVNVPSLSEPFPLTQHTQGNSIGDIEAALHYQINSGTDGWPFFIGNIRYKSNTGTGPFQVPFDATGRPAESPTGSGFQSFEPSLTALYPSDPAVFFANIGYLYNLSDNVNRDITNPSDVTQKTHIGKVSPGDAFRMSFGMGYSVNDKASLTLGIKHDWVESTRTEIDGRNTVGRKVKIGSLLMGWSYMLNPNVYTNLNLELGITSDAPDFVMTLRVPFEAFQL